ncbi:MAG TPA: DUF58 domain-containing protein [Acidimicrobiia bacterium]|nr:DUF58 domain-containing protein [Acidimicrobiia bacterium]
MSPTPRLAALLAGAALTFLFLPPPLAVLLILALLAGGAGDALAVRRPPRLDRTFPGILARGVPADLRIDVDADGATTRVRQPVPPDLDLRPREADGPLQATLVPRRRGRHPVPPPAVWVEGRFGLGRVHHEGGKAADVLVYPDMPAAHRLVAAVRQGRFRDPGVLTRGPLGLGTDFESIREYLPDDDIRQVNWRASARTGRPMSNQYRVEQDRSVICCIDSGRLMAAPVSATPGSAAGAGVPLTRLDAALDAAVAVALVADEIGDQAGAIAFDSTVRRRVPPRRRGGTAVVHTLFDLEPTSADSDYELAFRQVGTRKRSLVIVFTDVLEEGAARTLVEAVPVLARRHHVVVASARDPDFDRMLRTPPAAVREVLAASVVVEALDARAKVAAQLTRAGAEVLEAPPDSLAAACVGAYLRAKARSRL